VQAHNLPLTSDNSHLFRIPSLQGRNITFGKESPSHGLCLHLYTKAQYGIVDYEITRWRINQLKQERILGVCGTPLANLGMYFFSKRNRGLYRHPFLAPPSPTAIPKETPIILTGELN
jgi:hypothetical protein